MAAKAEAFTTPKKKKVRISRPSEMRYSKSGARGSSDYYSDANEEGDAANSPKGKFASPHY